MTDNNKQQHIFSKQQKMSNRIGQMPRSIKFNDNSIRNFVKSSSFLNQHMNATSMMTKQNYHKESKMMPNTYNFNNNNIRPPGFDFYNKNNLLLKSCIADDIQYVHRNPVIYQQDVLVMPEHPTSSKHISNYALNQFSSHSPSANRAKTMKDFYKPNLQKEQSQQNQNKKSKQAELNDFLFNYRKQEEEKKNRRLKFLQQVENKLNNLQKQAAFIETQKQRQYEQINGILKITKQTSQYAQNAHMLGKVNGALMEFQENKDKLSLSPRKITDDMELLQINVAIQEHHDYNDVLLQQIQRISRSKSKSRQKGGKRFNFQQQTSPKKQDSKKVTNKFDTPQQSSLSKTLKRPMQAPPRPKTGGNKMVSTTRNKD